MDETRRRWLPDDEVSVASRARSAALLRAWAPFRFGGRLDRGTYVTSLLAWHAACAIVSGVVFAIVLVAANLIGGDGAMTTAFFATAAVFGLVYVAALVGYAVRRLHDLNRGGAWVVLGFVPLVGLVFGVYLLVAPGTDGANAHGDAPPRPVLTVRAPAAPSTPMAPAATEARLEAAFDEGRRFAERRHDGA